MGLGGNSFQIFESKGPFRKIFRNKDLAGLRPPKIVWGSFEVRRLSTDTLRNCPNQLPLLSQHCELGVNYYCGEWLAKIAGFPIWECPLTCRSARQPQRGRIKPGNGRRREASPSLDGGSNVRNGRPDIGANPRFRNAPAVCVLRMGQAH